MDKPFYKQVFKDISKVLFVISGLLIIVYIYIIIIIFEIKIGRTNLINLSLVV